MVESSSLYGFDIDPGLFQQLRREPPVEALEWLQGMVGARRVVGVEPLAGGTSSAVHRVILEDRTGEVMTVVLRRFVLDWIRDEPHAPANEAHVLSLLTDTKIKAPRLIAADLDGSQTGTPTVVMSSLPGVVDWHPTDGGSWLHQLAREMVAIHQVEADALEDWFVYKPRVDLMPPPWTRYPKAWNTALEQYLGSPPGHETVFLHRDYHPGNVLWSAGKLSGIVDWVGSCRGPAEQDVAHCRANLVVHAGSVDAADEYLRIWQTLTDQPDAYSPYWDLVDVISWVTESPDPALDDFVARAAAQVH